MLFIDGANLQATTKALGFDIDFSRLLRLFHFPAQLMRPLYYTALRKNGAPDSIRPLTDWLDYNGYSMITRPTKEFTDSSGQNKIKGNMDIDLAVGAMFLADHLDHFVLFSGDGDFLPLVIALQKKGKQVTVVSTTNTTPPVVAKNLRRQANNFVDLADLEEQISRTSETAEYKHQ